jgi:hypothetical protein
MRNSLAFRLASRRRCYYVSGNVYEDAALIHAGPLPVNDMKKWLTIVALLWLAACQAGTGTAPTLEPTAEVTPDDEVTQVSASGVTLAIRAPAGWQSVPNEYGILLAEHTELDGNQRVDGILVYVFVQGIAELDLDPAPANNPALRLLNHVTGMPDDSLRNASISATTPFKLGAHEAAYYLLSDGHGNKTLVLAMADSMADKVIVCNVSAPRQEAQRIRAVLPMMLERLTIDGQAVDMTGLELLPDPLVFPEHRRDDDDADASEDADNASAPSG